MFSCHWYDELAPLVMFDDRFICKHRIFKNYLCIHYLLCCI